MFDQMIANIRRFDAKLQETLFVGSHLSDKWLPTNKVSCNLASNQLSIRGIFEAFAILLIMYQKYECLLL